MIVISSQAHLRALGISASFRLALPDSACGGRSRVPYVLCLHDYGQNGERLLQTLCCERLVDGTNAALLLPDGQNGCFLDMAHGPKWETYLLEGLLPFAERTFPLLSNPGLFGTGTGGWAAARLAALEPFRFPASLAVNADPDLLKAYAAGKLAAMPDLEAALGGADRVPSYPLCAETVWLHGVTAGEALAKLLENDWSTPA